MEILYFLIPLSLLIISVAVLAFFWAVNNKQFDDLDSPAYMILFDDEIYPSADSVTDSKKPAANADKSVATKTQDIVTDVK